MRQSQSAIILKYLVSLKLLMATGLAFFSHESLASMPVRSFPEHPLVRPPTAGHADSERFPLRIHWAEGVDQAYCLTMLKTAEVAWERMFNEMGFMAPLSDLGEGGSHAFDVYIVTNLQPGIGGYTSFSGFNEDTPHADAYGYVVFAHDLKPRYLRGVVAHELFHASQMAYDWWEDVSFMEASSTWIVDHVFDDEDLYWKYYSWYNRQPWKALDFISLADPYQYGAGMFLQFLDEHYGQGDGSFVRAVWELSVQNDPINEPDFFDAIDALLKQQGQSFEKAFHDFGTWRVLVGPMDDSRHFAEGSTWGPEMAVPLAADLAWDGLQKPESGRLEHPLQPYSHAFFRVTGERLPQQFTATTDPVTRLQIKWFLRKADGGIDCEGESPVLPGGGRIDLPSTCGQRVGADSRNDISGDLRELWVYVTNLADGAYDTESPVWTESQVEWSFLNSTIPGI